MSPASLHTKVLLGLSGVLKPRKGFQRIISLASSHLLLMQSPANLSLLSLIVRLVCGMLP